MDEVNRGWLTFEMLLIQKIVRRRQHAAPTTLATVQQPAPKKRRQSIIDDFEISDTEAAAAPNETDEPSADSLAIARSEAAASVYAFRAITTYAGQLENPIEHLAKISASLSAAAALAAELLCILPSAASIESIFSATGFLTKDRRSMLGADMLEAKALLHVFHHAEKRERISRLNIVGEGELAPEDLLDDAED